jgi:Flp pilus assembly protein TadG
MALIMLPFFCILFAIIDYAQIYFYDNALQNALRESARFATAGRIIQNTNPAYETNTTTGQIVPRAINDSSGQEASRNECIRYWFQSNCILNVPITNVTIYSASTLPGDPPNVTTNNGVLHLVSGFTVTTNAGTVSTNSVPPVPGPGNAGDYVEITAVYNVGTITPLFGFFLGQRRASPGTSGYPLRVSAIVKNEPALLNFEHLAIYTNSGGAPTEPNESTNGPSN